MKKLLNVIKSKKFVIPAATVLAALLTISAIAATKAEALAIEDETED